MVENLLSVIVRFHDPDKRAQLDEALFSLSCQSYSQIQVILAVQISSEKDDFQKSRFSPEILDHLQKLISQQPFEDLSLHKIIQVEVPPGIDGRSILLNEGVKAAEGQFLAFLDYDDVVYHHSYELLIRQIHQKRIPIAVGGCILAVQRWIDSDGQKHLYTESKRPYLPPPLPGQTTPSKSKLDLFAANFIPIHTFVLDRSQIDPSLLHFNPSLKCYEDYEVLLKLASQYEFDFSQLGTAIAEYRIRNDGSNTIPTADTQPELQEQWSQSKAYIEDLKSRLPALVNAQELSALVRSHDQLLAERHTLTFLIAGAWYSFTEKISVIRKFKKLSIAGTIQLMKKLRKIRIFIFRTFRYND